jgi:hypothetical protein
MIMVAILFGVLSAIVGYGFSVLTGGSIAGAMATTAGILLFFVVVITFALKRFNAKANVSVNI